MLLLNVVELIHVSNIFIPLSFQRVIQQAKINSDSFKNQWSSFNNPNLYVEIPIPLSHINNQNDGVNELQLAKNEILLLLNSKLGLEPQNFGFPDEFITACGIYRVRKGTVALMVIVEFILGPERKVALCKIKSNNEKGIVEAVAQLIPQQIEKQIPVINDLQE